MSNLVCVQFTRFQDIDTGGKPSEAPAFGYRIYDDYGGEDNTCFNSVEEMVETGLTPEGIFDYILNHHDSFWEEALNRGVMLNDVYLPPPKEDEDHAVQMRN